MVEYHFTFEFETQDGETVTASTVATTRQEAYSTARQSLIDDGAVDDIQAFESTLSLRLTRYGYENPPWATTDEELVDVFRSMDSVGTARYSAPMEDEYGPPTWYLRAASEKTLDDVIDAVEAYFEGFSIEKRGESVAVSTKSPEDIE